MYYIIRRKNNLFSKNTFEKIAGEGSLEAALKNKQIQKTTGGLFRGINNEEYRQWRRIPDLYERSGARKYINDLNSNTLSLTKAKELGIDIPMALSSGFVLQRPEGLIYDRGQYRPVIQSYNQRDYSINIITRVGNKFNSNVFKRLEIPEELVEYNPDTGLYEGKTNDVLSKILTIENPELVGFPYMMLDQLYQGTTSSYNITEYNIDNIIELIISGHVFVNDNKIYLDHQDIKRHNYYNWVGKYIYCMS